MEKQLQLAMMFQDNCVLQQEKPCPVWGKAKEGNIVSVQVQDQHVTVVADSNGEWRATLGPLHASTEETLIVRSGWSEDEQGADLSSAERRSQEQDWTEEILCRHVAVGEVWLLGGQSNMEFQMRYDATLHDELERDTFENIRFFAYPQVSYEGQLSEFDYSAFGKWRQASAEELEYFGAVGYYFADKIAADKQVPVGFLACNWGGTPACAWMDIETVKECGPVWIEEYERSLKDHSIGLEKDYILHREWGEAVSSEEEQARTEYENAYRLAPRVAERCAIFSQGNDSIMYPTTREQQLEMMKLWVNVRGGVSDILGPWHPNRPGGLYQTMLLHTVPYAIKGVLWYQGESDQNHADIYGKMFAGLIRNWRTLWNENLPFLCVQLAPFGTWLTCTGHDFETIRAAQEMVSDHIEGVYLASIGDVGDHLDTHPKRKRKVGERLALLAQKYVYGENVEADAPRCVNAYWEEGEIVLKFSHTQEGLSIAGDPAKEMEIICIDTGEQVSKEDYEVRSVGNRLIIRFSDLNYSGTSCRISYCVKNYYEGNVYGQSGLPVFPFEINVQG